MRLGPLIFWIIMFFWFLFGIVAPRWAPNATGAAYYPVISTVLSFVLLFILGAYVFGVPKL
jgi:hypothetical protein